MIRFLSNNFRTNNNIYMLERHENMLLLFTLRDFLFVFFDGMLCWMRKNFQQINQNKVKRGKRQIRIGTQPDANQWSQRRIVRTEKNSSEKKSMRRKMNRIKIKYQTFLRIKLRIDDTSYFFFFYCKDRLELFRPDLFWIASARFWKRKINGSKACLY